MTILYPMGALVAWTFTVGALVLIVRVRAVHQGSISIRDLTLGESPAVPATVALFNRNFMNLLELPLLFHVACLTLYVTKTVDGTALTLAWLYVALRVCHSLIHVTYNNVVHRAGAYGASTVVLLVIWVRAFIALSGG